VRCHVRLPVPESIPDMRAAAFARLLPVILPLGTIALARLLTFSDWATQQAGLAAILYAWIVADSLLLGLIAKAPEHKPGLFQVLGIVSLATLAILLGASAPVRDIYFSLPPVLFAAAGILMLFAIWGGVRIISAWRQTRSWRTGFENVFPKQLVRIAISECRVLWLGLFRWRSPVDAPAGTRAFAYHTYLTPMLAALLVLQLIELSVVHLLLMRWSPSIAWIILGLSTWGVIWTIALLKSFRIKPVLLKNRSVHVRTGMIYDFEIPINSIADTRTGFTSDELATARILNLALMSSPNVTLRLAEPITIRTFSGRRKKISGVALRLDDSSGFVTELARRS